ncbi:hypothetical protein ETB97_011805 [Aspergillus alliaceus]|uniref:Xylanolytic transcriptional activator regulatory domain-containing protein n=1 Tax=Petromyces alliaceus TaxID=209559 RepID=A0A8H6A845_PETAA|nr:hypothetical protein ETB97_011805 [Aspergillus burnettii]
MSLCQYEGLEPPKTPLSGDSSSSGTRNELNVDSKTIEPNGPLDLNTDTALDRNVLVSGLGYSAHTSHSTLGVLGALETHSYIGTPFSASKETVGGNLQYDIASKYKDSVRYLPASHHIHQLLDFFFSHVNWAYDVIDEITFRRQLESWTNIPYSMLQRDPNELDPEIRVFPALLLQVLAQTLLYHPSNDETLVSLKYMPGMSFHDVAKELSDAGATILDLLGKRCLTLGTVQTGLLRAAFLKSSGLVVEAWHTLGSAIRDAQELGLHFNEGISEQRLPCSDAEEAVWDRERRSRLWLILHIWDTHMAVVLGRPIATQLQQGTFTLPQDVCARQEWTLPTKRTEADPPTAFSVLLAGYNTAYQYFPTIHRIEQKGGRQEDYVTVDKVHAAIMQNIHSLPSWCRADKSDSRYDREVGCTWLPAARETLWSLVHFVLLALHRPYIFSAPESRTRALKAGLQILNAQSRLFRLFEPQQPKVFNMIYASFDALVLVAAIYILYPQENREDLKESLQSIEWGLSTLATLGEHNEMARTAHGVVLALYRRLKPRLDNYRSSASMNGESSDNIHAPAPHPMQDLFFQHLSGVTSPVTNQPFTLLDDLTLGLPDTALQFGGTYPSDSFWNFMNEYTFPTFY